MNNNVLLDLIAKLPDDELANYGLMRISKQAGPESSRPVVESPTTTSPSGKPSKKMYEQRVTAILKEFGIPAHLKGYGYLRDAIISCIEDSTLLDSVTKSLYPTVAKHFNTTTSRTERAIRHAIEQSSLETTERYFGKSVLTAKGDKPTNSHFIAAIVDSVIIGELQ